MATSQREEAKLTSSAHHAGRVWRPVGGDGLGESRAGSCPLLGDVGGGWQPEWGGSVGKGLCLSTSSIPHLPKSTPTLLAGE